MVSFDIMQAVFNAYQTLWRERFYLLRLGAIPFALAYLNFIAVSLIETDVSALRHTLLLFPTMVAEAWLICQFLRTLITGERWPLIPPLDVNGRPPPQYFTRVRGLLSGMIVYVLIIMTLNVFAGTIATLWDNGTLKGLIERGDPVYTIANFTVLYLALRWFKALWLHIPFILNIRPRAYFAAIPGWMPSIHLIGLWLAASIPIMGGALLLLNIFAGVGEGSGAQAFIGFLLINFFNVFAQLAIALATSTAATYALVPLLLPGRNRHV